MSDARGPGASLTSRWRGLLIALVGAIVVFTVVVGTILFFFVRQVRHDAPATQQVTLDAQVEPLPDGIRVRATITSVSGPLADFTLPTAEQERYYATAGPDRAVVNARATLTGMTVDGAAATPGSRVRPTSSSVELAFDVARRDDGRRVVWVAPELSGLQPVKVNVSAAGSPTSCLVPEGGQAVQDYFTFTECGNFPVQARRALPTAPGYSRLELPATVRIAYDPPAP